ncbi:MAG: ATP-binding protein [Longimicrobiales bacterium]|nr:ATP-binding protein [Longimicrobiales bacterium]
MEKPRRPTLRLALLFGVVQAIAVALPIVFLTLPSAREPGAATLFVLAFLVVDVVILVFFSRWLIAASVSGPVEDLSRDVRRIADGDYHHRVADPLQPELRAIQRSVNRLADRLITDQERLAQNVASLEETNRQLRQARDQVIQAARMASVGTLAAGIAHEVGNPLGAIIGFVDVARARAMKRGEEVELLDSIKGEACRIDRIVRGLLDYARPSEAGATPIPAREVLSRVRQILESQGSLDEVDVTWRLESGERQLLDQPHRLEQVMVNLMLNALHAVDDVPAPRIEVLLREEAGAVQDLPPRREDDPPGINYMHRRRHERDEEGVATVQSAERLVRLEVSDNGHGIAPEIRARLFDPFFTTKEPGKGTGLGLSICARLVEGMGGRIEAENRREGGARFVIRIPVLYDTADVEVSAHHAQATS